MDAAEATIDRYRHALEAVKIDAIACVLSSEPQFIITNFAMNKVRTALATAATDKVKK